MVAAALTSDDHPLSFELDRSEDMTREKLLERAAKNAPQWIRCKVRPVAVPYAPIPACGTLLS